MNHHMHSRRPARLLVVLLIAALLAACAGERSPSAEERQAAAAATIAAARATEAAAAQVQAELTRAAIPSPSPLPTNTPMLTETSASSSITPNPTTTESIAASKDIVAAEGGSIELSDGTQLDIPPDALSSDGNVSIARLNALPAEAGDLGDLEYQAYEITSPSHALEISATITFPYQDFQMSDAFTPNAVFAAYWDGSEWQVMKGLIDSAQKTLSLSTDHFSLWGIFRLPSADKMTRGLEIAIATGSDHTEGNPDINTVNTIIRELAEVNSPVKPVSARIVPGFSNFAYGSESGYINADMDWFRNVGDWIPESRLQLLLVPILAHELSHANRGDNVYSILFETILKHLRLLNRSQLVEDEIMRNLAKFALKLARGNNVSAQELTEYLRVAIFPIYHDLCGTYNEKEFIADKEGSLWAKKYFEENKDRGSPAEMGLIYATFFDRLAQGWSCDHPTSSSRIDEIFVILGLGSNGGIYGRVTPPLADISVDGKAQGAVDEDGKFLVTGITSGPHNVKFSMAGFQSQTLSVEVPSQRLLDMTKDSPVSLQPLSLTPIPITTPALTPIPVRRPGLITDFETWGAWTRGDEAWGTFTQSNEQVFAGSYSGKFTYNFPAVPNNYLVYRQTIPIAGRPAVLRIMVYGDGSGNYLNAWVQDANGQLWQFTFGQIYHTGWQPMSAALDVSRCWPNQAIGGNSTTAAPVYPLRFYALVLDGYREDTALQGAVYVDELLAGDADVLVPIPTTSPTPSAATPTTAPTTNASISFRADVTSINAGDCTTLRWDVDNVTAVYLDDQGVAGHESRQICPTATQTYTLKVTRQDGSQQQATVTIQVTGIAATPTSPPSSIPPAGPCEAIPGENYDALSIQGSPSDRPAESHADLNLALRGYERNNAALQFSDYGPAVDPNGPQLPGLFADQRTPGFTSTYQVFDWDWGCNCRGGLLNQWDVTLLGMAVNPGEPIRVPDSGRSIGSGYEVLVLYASPDRITLKYTPDDNVVSGYTIHIEDVCVEPNLLGLYQSLNQSGRGRLPALRAGQSFGRAKSGEIKVAIRDGGAFFDPRSRQDWWRGR